MINTIQFGDTYRIGAYSFPERKKPCLAIHDLKKNAIYVVGQFRDEGAANIFMDTLGKCVCVKEAQDDKRRQNPSDDG